MTESAAGSRDIRHQEVCRAAGSPCWAVQRQLALRLQDPGARAEAHQGSAAYLTPTGRKFKGLADVFASGGQRPSPTTAVASISTTSPGTTRVDTPIRAEAQRDFADAQADATRSSGGYGTGNPFLAVDQRNEIIAADMRAKGYRLVR